MTAHNLDDIIALCKRRGFLFPSGNLYGGLQGVYDYGPLGLELKNALKNHWWSTYVYQRNDIIGLDSAILSHPLTFHYSGHDSTFTDLLVDCRKCQRRFRADHIAADQCPHCKSDTLTEPRAFNLMFKTTSGAVSQEQHNTYLRPETAQGIFTNFKQITDAFPKDVPFGIAQIGKAFRNEITPRHFIFRVREFEQMEIEFFVKPEQDEQWFQQWVEWRYQWWLKQGLSAKNLRLVPQPKAALAHYAKATTDIEYQFPHGFEELEGIANRADYDLGSHTKAQAEFNLHSTVIRNTDSTQKLALFDRKENRWFIPYVIEPSAGLDRGVLAILNEAYHVEQLENKQRIVLKLQPHLAPIKVAVIPLARNHPEIMSLARQVKQKIQQLSLGVIAFEDSGNIGKNYRRHDEIGTPLCITIDFESLESYHLQDLHKVIVTLRDRDSMQQTQMAIAKLLPYLQNYFSTVTI